jgi:RNA polymerase sigma-70 factor (ECF subfamily)
MSDNEELKTWFSNQIEKNMDSLYSMALRLTRNNTDAEDLVAESVTKAWSSIRTLKNKKRFRPWMFRILHNRFISDYRKQSIRPVENSYDEAADTGHKEEIASILIKQPDEFLDWWANPESEFSNTLLGEDIMTAIDSLPESFRITVIMVNVEGLSYDEAAIALDVPAGTVRSRMKRGRTLLQKMLWEHATDAGLITGNSNQENKPHEQENR